MVVFCQVKMKFAQSLLLLLFICCDWARSCGDLGVPKNGGVKVVYSCNKGYILLGPRERICDETGQWTGEQPNCTFVTCGRPKGLNSQNLTYKASGFDYGSTIHYTCKTNYKIDGDNFVTCNENGKWSRAVPKCLAPCNSPPGVSSKRKIFLHGEAARSTQFNCGSGEILLGFPHPKKAAKCRDGEWTLKFFCKKKGQKIAKTFWGRK